ASVQTLKQGPALQAGLPTALVFPDLAALSKTIMIEKEFDDAKAYLKTELAERGVDARVQLYSLDVTADQSQAAVAAAQEAGQTLVFLYDAHIHPTQKSLLDAVRAAGKRVVVALMRDAYDAEFVPDGTLCVTNYGPRVDDVRVILNKAVASASPSAV